MSDDVAKSLKRGMEEALAFAQGEKTGARVHIPDEINVARIRKKYSLTQKKFADAFGFSVRTVQQWEQGRRVPDGAAKSFLFVIDKEPDAVRRALTI